MAGAWM
jgi:hypothetical protein